jgi:SAM-dependent methyltransferase
VGCGAGRWLRTLARAGYKPTGIDLQPALIESITERHPDFEAHVSAIQDFEAEPFDLVSSVTVIQHIPVTEQVRAIERLAALTKPGGHALILENTHDHGIHVWAHGPEEWIAMFEAAGFKLLEQRRYDYSPGLRAVRRLNLRRRQAPSPEKAAKVLTPETYRMKGATKPPKKVHKQRKPPKGLKARARWELTRAMKARNRFRKDGLRRIAVGVDSYAEPLLVKTQPKARTHHCAFLFERV